MTTPAPTDLIEVPIDALASPSKTLILADTAFLSTLAAVEKQVAELKITDAQSAQAAANLTARLTSAGKVLEQQRTQLKAPFVEMGRKIDAAAREPAGRIDAAKAILSRLQTGYATEQARLAREAEAARLAELARLEKIRQEEAKAEAARQAELQRQADEAAAQAQSQGVDILDDEEAAPSEPTPPSATEQAIAQLQAAPAVVAPKPVGIRFKVTLEPVVEDVNKLPDIFITKTPKLAAIKAAYCTGYTEDKPLPVCPGVRFEVRREAQSTGRSSF